MDTYLEINITTRKELEIYMNAQRQRLLKTMEVCNTPMTPKQLSDRLEISPSSVTYHLKKLESLGLVALDHTEIIHGIQAKFYKKIPAIVNLKADMKDDLYAEKMVLAEYSINDTWSEFKKYVSNLPACPDEEGSCQTPGDFMNGIVYLSDEEAKQLKDLITQFHKNHTAPAENTTPWEMALVAFPRNNS